jgi:hypothetical protein
MGDSEMSELAKALAKAQSEIEVAIKDAKNPHFKSSYATLASTWDALRAPLTKNGLSVVQAGKLIDGKQILVTRLEHSSGEFRESEILLINQKNDMQGLGSAWSYARRYALQAIAGIAQDDDDGNAAVAQRPPPAKEEVPWPDEQPMQQDFSPRAMLEESRNKKPMTEATLKSLTFSFGKLKGKPLSEADDNYIDWLIKDLEKPDRKYPLKASDMELLEGLHKEQARRNSAPMLDLGDDIPF